MPHVLLEPGTQNSAGDFASRALIPGIEPGASSAGRPMKPALLLKDAWVTVIDWTPPNSADAFTQLVALKLSQDQDLDPGLRIPVAEVGLSVQEGDATGRHAASLVINNLFHAQNTIWVPAFIGVQLVVAASFSVQLQVHLDYERIEVPWMDWFLMWDWLDNITNNEWEY